MCKLCLLLGLFLMAIVGDDSHFVLLLLSHTAPHRRSFDSVRLLQFDLFGMRTLTSMEPNGPSTLSMYCLRSWSRYSKTKNKLLLW